MRAWTIPSFGLDNLKLTDRPEPTPGPGQVTVAVRAVSLNYRDLLIVKGQYNPRMSLPRVPCSDAAGEVVAVGPGVTRVGRRRPRVRDVHAALGRRPAHRRGRPVGPGRRHRRRPGRACRAGRRRGRQVPGPPVGRGGGDVAVRRADGLARSGRGRPTGRRDRPAPGHRRRVDLRACRSRGSSGPACSSPPAATRSSPERSRWAPRRASNYRTTPDWDKWARSQTGGVGVDHVVEVGGAGTLERSFKACPDGRAHRPDRRADRHRARSTRCRC